MPEGAFGDQVQEALEDLQAYLSDLQPPLLVVSSVGWLVEQPAELGAAALRAWAAGQQRLRQGAVPPSELYHHALKKLRLLGDLKLVPAGPLATYLDALVEDLAAAAPEAERETLRSLIRQVGEVGAGLSPPADYLQRLLDEAAGRGSAGLDEQMVRNLRHFALLLERATAARNGPGGSEQEQRDLAGNLVPQLIAAAAQGSRNVQEFELYLSSLSRAGFMKQVRMSDLFRTLSRALPEWSLRQGDEATTFQGEALRAMLRIIALEQDPARNAGRFRDLLKAAAEQFNGGSLARAVTILDLARQIIAEHRVEKQSVDLILGAAHEELDPGQLTQQMQAPARWPLLRSLLNFYPALTPQGLWEALSDEPDRGRRRLLLGLVEVHGAAGRAAALDQLELSFSQPEQVPWYIRRNFVYLLHRIPPPQGTDLTREVALTARCSELQGEAALVRDALANLGLRRHPEAERTLRVRLEQIERMLQSTAPAAHEPTELWRMLNVIISALVRFGTASARRAVVDHGLRQQPRLGDTLARLAELGTLDLTEDPGTVERLVAALRALLPKRPFGLSLRHGPAAESLVRALASTRAPAVRALFEELSRRFPGEAIGKLAQDAVAAQDRVSVKPGWAGPPTPPPAPAAAGAPGMSGELEAFGLPELVQGLAGAEASGRLLIKNRGGAVVGELTLRQGRLAEAQVGRLSGNEAFYQLLEAPVPGTFEFIRRAPEAVAAGTAQDFLPLLTEGMRRYDELQRARALAPDHGRLVATGARPTPRADEADGGFIRDVWTRVKAGATPRDCEEKVAADAYRIRALLAHWLEEGAIAVRQAPEVAPPWPIG